MLRMSKPIFRRSYALTLESPRRLMGDDDIFGGDFALAPHFGV